MPHISESGAHAYTEISEAVRTDNEGRIVLGADFADKTYRVSRNEHGELLLTPVVVMLEADIWLYKNPEAFSRFHQGLAEANEGNVLPAEDFSKYADLEGEEK